MRNLVLAALLTFAFLPSAWAFDSRFAINPQVSLANLEHTGLAMMTSGRTGNLYWADASAVLHINPDRMFAAAKDYENYVSFGMPYLNASHVVEPEKEGVLFTWASMSIYTMSSQHYLEVHVHPTMGAGSGMEWQLAHKQPNSTWAYGENSSFTRSDGSFYIQRLDSGAVYVRYYLINDVNTFLGSWASGIIQSKLRQGAAEVISALANQAR